MFGKFITDTYNKVKSKADEVRQQVSVQAIKAKGALGLVNPKRVDEIEVLINYELQQISTVEHLIDTYKKWIHNLELSEKSDSIRYHKLHKQKNGEKEQFSYEKEKEKEKNSWKTNNTPNIRSHENAIYINTQEISQQKNEKEKVRERDREISDLTNFKISRERPVNMTKDSIEKTKMKKQKTENDSSSEKNSMHISSFNKVFHSEKEIEKEIEIEKETETKPYFSQNENQNQNQNQNESQNQNRNSYGSCSVSFSSNGNVRGIGSGIGSDNDNDNDIGIDDKSGDIIYDDLYGYNFKEIFLKSNILEKSISLIIENKNIRLPLVGPIEEDDLENPRTIILTLFKYCFRGDGKLHKDILFIILTTDTIFDTHKELFLELLGILKFDYVDIYLTNVRKIITAEVVALKAKIHLHNSLHNWNETIINEWTCSENKENMITDLLMNHKIVVESAQNTNTNAETNTNTDTLQFHLEKEKEKKRKMLQTTVETSKEDFLLWDEDPLFGKDEEKEEEKEEEEEEKEKEEEKDEEEEEMFLTKTNKEPADPIKKLAMKLAMNNQNEYDIKKKDSEQVLTKIGMSEKEIIESNKIQQIKVLASSKLIVLHKNVHKILMVAAKNREMKKKKVLVKIEELKKIIQVCQKDCEITLVDTEGSKTNLENTYLQQTDFLKEHIKTKQEEAEEMKKYINNLIKRKNELYNQYDMVCKEILLKNQQLSKITSFITTQKKELAQTKDLYSNKIFTTTKAKHLQQERKLYISNLNTISDEIINVYETSEHVDTEELKRKSEKMIKPIKQVIIQHLNYLKEKLILLNILLNFYIQQVKIILKQKVHTNTHTIIHTNTHTITHTNTNMNTNNTNTLIPQQIHTNEDTQPQDGPVPTMSFKRETFSSDELFETKDSKECINEINDEENKRKILNYYKNCYFKVVEQINKLWIKVQEFYEQNKQHLEDEEEEEKEEKEEKEEVKEIEGGKENETKEKEKEKEKRKQLQLEINRIYDICKHTIQKSNPIILSI